MNAVVIAVCLMLAMSIARINVVIALTVSAVVAGVVGGLSIDQTVTAFNDGLGGGAKIALSYALLGAFAVALSHSGLTNLVSSSVLKFLGKEQQQQSSGIVRYVLIAALVAMSISSQNILPIHIAFIPILIPPLLQLMTRLQLDRRLVACSLTFGLVTTYMVLPVGFGGIFLNDILLTNLNENGLSLTSADVPSAMLIPAMGMVLGLLVAIFISYRKPRQYHESKEFTATVAAKVSKKDLAIAILAIVATLAVQLRTDSMIFGALVGFIIFSFSGALKQVDKDDVFTRGTKMMASIGFIMIAASGFAAVVDATGQVATLVKTLGEVIGDNKGLAAFLMLVVGLLITMGIGSSFSTIPIIATIYVPLALHFGFSSTAVVALVGTAAALGDAGSPASDSTLGPTAGLNVDGQHDHIRDSVIPTFIHYNIPLLIFGWIAAMVL
ncbi:Na+/H+ antiporter family protein [Shewanella sp. C32]|uniref:Na+/H+ antiporter family protein n=1 Tax=Shewanella electrica TaxID=515560 RepID=A0ABT2FN98_9GAMM|nr:Na+/H+ antiporter family protein [Shewanella electrica]MCH1924904.1 Na+/H+ antiporter family protein [Shewanella electrica]MCS4556651.1 Na+/H+ antiporter family protein [Shewanella electrica]